LKKKAAPRNEETHATSGKRFRDGPVTRSKRCDRDRLRARYERLAPVHEVALQTLHRDLHQLLLAHGFSPTIKSRVKRFGAYLDKIAHTREQRPGTVAITDLLGLRVICTFLEDIERAVGLFDGAFEVVEVERRGAEHSFREFGYDSVHLLVKVGNALLPESLPHTRKVCEIQLRTTLQDAWAEVEHELVYKTDISLPNESIKRKLAALNANLTLADLMFQEIRDQQREFREQGRKRRESVTAGISPPELPALSAPHSTELKARKLLPLELASLTGTSRLEKTLIEALQAHSGEDLESAVRLYGQALRMKIARPVRSMVYHHRGMARFGLARYGEALRDFTRGIQLGPGNTRGHIHRALTYRVLKNYARAMEDYNRALQIEPACLDALWGRAQAECDLQRYTRALADCESALNVQPDFVPARELSRMIRLRIF